MAWGPLFGRKRDFVFTAVGHGWEGTCRGTFPWAMAREGDAGDHRALEALGRTPRFSADNRGSHGRALMFSSIKILVLAQTRWEARGTAAAVRVQFGQHEGTEGWGCTLLGLSICSR